ncbi:nucleoside deaminase [Sandaracinobacter sp. RS1-74]|uniref:nucleoside deaminase n=1 Tax=Sandaracinobacteroides sayramensis TaxID=2913411 RepID=UPI001EDB6BDD|nr:nucleoside deaminase [Sandaracinobacteroides sayramensis]MCG2840352.1 nucleoside deaminase [Sandaracinobacteroides sayramensis]
MAFPANPQMARALELARAAAARGEVPVGAVLTSADGSLLAEAHNLTKTLPDPTAHAEMLVLREAALKLGSERLPGCTLTVTLEPCPMCAAAIAEARVARLVYAASDPKGGGVEHGPRIFAHSRHKPEIVAGISEAEAAALLLGFFQERR